MIINTNMAALNTTRQLGINEKNTQSSLAKLSSGLRINSAADDAAGLAISEKMRGQIRGLNQASANAQNGISMVSTAEANLNETTSILQRMKELATNAASDTNTPDDRDAMQKEMNQLTSEINRIGNTAEFNTQKLLNGGGVETQLTVNTVKAGAAAGNFDGAGAFTRVAVGSGTAAVTSAVTVDGTNTVTVTSGAANGATANAYSIKFDSASSGSTTASVQGSVITVHLDKTNAAIAAADIQTALTGLTVPGLDASKFTVAVSAAVDGTKAITSAVTGLGSGTAGISAATALVAADNAYTMPITTITAGVQGNASVWDSGAVTALGNGASGTVTFNGVTVSINSSASGAVGPSATDGRTASVTVADGSTADQTAAAIVSAFNAAKAYGGSELKDFTFTTNGSQFKITDTFANGATNNALNITTSGVTLTGGAKVAGVTEVRGKYTVAIDKAFEAAGMSINIDGQTFTTVASGAKASAQQINVGTDVHQQALELAQAMNANATISSRFDATVDDAGKITLTEKTGQAFNTALASGYVVGNKAMAGIADFTVDTPVAVGGKYEIDGVKIAVTDDASDSRIAQGTAVLYNADKATQTQNLMQAITANASLNTKYTATASSNTITLTQKTGQESMVKAAALTGTNANDGFTATFQIGANTGQTMIVDMSDMRSLALGISGTTAGATLTAKNGAQANLTQIKTASNGSDNNNVEYSLDLSTASKATAAISIIDDATAKVSAERAKLGAYQNRLEHTINNLQSSSQNITSAEASIRDVDMASEMTNFQKNNILQQAAQAMLAQANQQGQGVLQLLR
ncbi:MAG: flagellin [Veillonellales bacterium]